MNPIRFRVWDNEDGEYLAEDSFVMNHDGSVVWYDGHPIDPARHEVEFGNTYCFHNDIVQAKAWGGHWVIESAGKSYYDEVPREHVNMHVCKSDSSAHELYWHIPIRGVAMMLNDTMEFHMCGFTCKDKFYGYEGDKFFWKDISVVGNARMEELKFCEAGRMWYERYLENSILPNVNLINRGEKK